MLTIAEQLSSGILRCPICLGRLQRIKLDRVGRNLSTWGVVSCECEEYPVLEGILFLSKTDDALNRKLSVMIRNGKYSRAMALALRECGRIYGRLFFILWFINFRFGVGISKQTIYSLLAKIGPKKEWYKYLNYRKEWKDLDDGYEVLTELNSSQKSNRIALDLGCGAGDSVIKLMGITLNIIGIDKYFDTLLLNRFYPSHDKLLICYDISPSIPVVTKSIISVTGFSMFSYILEKKKFVEELDRVIEPGGNAFFSDVGKVNTNFGYGISKKNLRNLFGSEWRAVRIFDEKNKKMSRSGNQWLLCVIKN